jgi:hypothetical protein
MAGFEKERDRIDAQMTMRGPGARVSDAGVTGAVSPARPTTSR